MRPGEGVSQFEGVYNRPIAHIAQYCSVSVGKSYVRQGFIIVNRKKSRYFVTSLRCRDFATENDFPLATQ